MIDYQHLIDIVRQRGTGARSLVHGDQHWRAVAQVGLALAAETPEADATVVLLFALFHDSMRWNDDYDPNHGRRAAEIAQLLHGTHYQVTPSALDVLSYACAYHADGYIIDDPQVGVCWDADRLNLWRVGMRPDPRWLSTAAARQPERIAWSQGIWERPSSWTDLIRKTALTERRPWPARPGAP